MQIGSKRTASAMSNSSAIPCGGLPLRLMPTALDIDGNFNPSINASVSRIRRDTRFTKDKSPYRDHMWIGFRLSAHAHKRRLHALV